MIPTLILLGLVFGRWWRFALVATAIVWPAALVLTGAMGLEWGLIGAAVLAMGNTILGVVVHQGVLRFIRHVRGQDPRPIVPKSRPSD